MTTRKWLPVTLPFSIGLIASAVYSSSRNLLRILGASARKSLLHPNRDSRDSSGSSVSVHRGARGRYCSHCSRHIRSRRSLDRTDCPDPAFRVRSHHRRATGAVACAALYEVSFSTSRKVRLPAEEN